MHHVIASEYYAHGEDPRRMKCAVVDVGNIVRDIQSVEMYRIISLYTVSADG